MAFGKIEGAWIEPDGRSRPASIKSRSLSDIFHSIGQEESRILGGSREDLAAGYSGAVWAYRCIKLRSDAVAGVPLVLLDRDGAAIKEHPILRLLRDVNPHTMNLGDLLRATESAYNIWGVCYWLKVRDPGQVGVRWLLWLNPQTIEVETDSDKGVIAYKQTVGSTTRRFAPEEVISFRNFNPLDDLGGLSPLSVALREVNAELNAARFVASFFANDARPAGLLTTEQAMPQAEAERVRTWWQTLFTGADKKWKTGIVGSGLRWQSISYPMGDLALTELRAENRRAICATFGVPSALAGAWEAATYASAREQKASFYEDTIIPQLNYIAEVLNWSLLPHYPDLTARDARLAWDIDGITALRESATDKAQRFTMLLNAGVISKNEVRAELGMTLIDETEVIEAESEAEADDPPTIKGQHIEERPTTIEAELARWKRFAIRRVREGRSLRDFKSEVIPPKLLKEITEQLAEAESVEDVRAIFDALKDEKAGADEEKK